MNGIRLLVALLSLAGISVAGSLHRCVVSPVTLEYPALARMAGMQGTILVRILVDREGKVIRAEAVASHAKGEASSAERVLRQAAVENAEKWRFAPLPTRAQPTEATIEYVFKMEGRASYYHKTENRFHLPNRVEVVTQPPSAER